MQIMLYRKEFEVMTGEPGEPDWFKPYVEVKLYLTRHSGFHFCCSIPSGSFCMRNPIKCIVLALEAVVQRELKLDRRLGE